MIWPDSVLALDDLGDVSDHGRQAEHLEQHLCVDEAIHCICRNERRAMLLSVSGHDDSEIGAVLGVSRQTAQRIRQHARAHLRDLLGDVHG